MQITLKKDFNGIKLACERLYIFPLWVCSHEIKCEITETSIYCSACCPDHEKLPQRISCKIVKDDVLIHISRSNPN